ncbi:hypothetical protein PITC_017880 [Penicillium italicum]|uniref:Uncharacterized protein n=1 Tax=Penicillium italicum TaxID=40296 RepID=A0A0A2LAX7_PENIT|nr:hypothetical protein PITC_017880 [Penicillium italicum]
MSVSNSYPVPTDPVLIYGSKRRGKCHLPAPGLSCVY